MVHRLTGTLSWALASLLAATAATAQPGLVQPGLAQPGLAQPGLAKPGLVQPAGSGLTLAGPATAPGPARFGGRVQVHGVLVAQWSGATGAAADGAPREPQYLLLLAPESTRTLPHWQGTPLQVVQITAQGPATLVALTSPALATGFLRTPGSTLSAEGLFLLHELAVGGRCGLAWAEAAVADADPVRLLKTVAPVAVPACAAR